jgi:hypothetical protein
MRREKGNKRQKRENEGREKEKSTARYIEKQ